MSSIAQGYNCFDTIDTVVGLVHYLPNPGAVLSFIRGGEFADKIILAEGGTTTFLAPVLNTGIAGIITLSGAPESHLGILAREFQIPCVMSVYLTAHESRYLPGGNNTAHFRALIDALNNQHVILDCTDAGIGRINLA